MKEKIRRMAAVSPAMNSITPYLIETIGGFGSLDRKPGDGEVENESYFCKRQEHTHFRALQPKDGKPKAETPTG